MSENSGMTDALSNHIRAVDGSHSLGAGALAEKIMEFFQPIIAERDALRQSVKARKDLVYAGQPQCQSPQPATLPATPATDNGQGLDYTPGWLDLTAPARIWLQVDTSADNSDRDESWPCDDGVSWCHESVGGLEVQYVRADLAANPPAAGAGGSAVWVGVGPVNPTPMMIQAGARARQNGGTCEEVYRAMLAVAPAVPATPESAEPVAESFADWLAREMPAGTVIGDPRWWAPKIERMYRATHPAPAASNVNEWRED
ncbi:MAG: hypothetical protein E6Q97_09485 [Desulfurellales bacterium]|nr:MAG: hypothetical protein E6Q97_09485 [Desulfurellales bacterium]